VHDTQHAPWASCLKCVFWPLAWPPSRAGASLHLCMTPHGPDTETFERATGSSDGPSQLPDDTLAFMFETHCTPRVTPAALGSPHIDRWDQSFPSLPNFPSILFNRLVV
jgi:homogentisate 1,2-dioxygenase